MSHMPWEMLKLTTVQGVLNDLGLSRYTNSTPRKQLVKILRDVETDGLEAVSQELEERQLAADRARSPSFSYVPNPREREESPELEYIGPPPRTVPVVEIRSYRPHPNVEAGPSRVRIPAPHPGASANRTSAVPLTRVGPPAKKRKVTATATVMVPPPSYAILYRQHQEIAPPAKVRYPLLRPSQRFDGVHLPAPRRTARLAGPAEPASASTSPGAGVREDDYAGAGTGASGHVDGGRTHGVAPESPTSLRRLEAVVVTPVEAVKARWGREVNGDMENEE